MTDDDRIKKAKEAAEVLIHELDMDLEDVVFFATAMKRGRHLEQSINDQEFWAIPVEKLEKASLRLCEQIEGMTPTLALGEIVFRAATLTVAKGRRST